MGYGRNRSWKQPKTDWEVGDWVSHFCYDDDAWVAGTIDSKGEKNGMVTFGVTIDDGRSKWGYADQFKAL